MSTPTICTTTCKARSDTAGCNNQRWLSTWEIHSQTTTSRGRRGRKKPGGIAQATPCSAALHCCPELWHPAEERKDASGSMATHGGVLRSSKHKLLPHHNSSAYTEIQQVGCIFCSPSLSVRTPVETTACFLALHFDLRKLRKQALPRHRGEHTHVEEKAFIPSRYSN
eukprot:XP_025011024.1 uncharacterized protein SMIM10L1 isoform X4 [Gallus gallus]